MIHTKCQALFDFKMKKLILQNLQQTTFDIMWLLLETNYGLIVDVNRLLADHTHQISGLIWPENEEIHIEKFVVCYSHDLHF